MNFIITVLRFLIIQSASGLSDDVLINLTGTKETLEDGSKVLHFNCSSPKPLKLPYVEVLINNTSIASLTLKNGTCNFLETEYNCAHICKCSFDDLTTHWTFPVPTKSKTQTVYSCQMFIVSNTTYEQAHIWYNGTDFLKPTEDKDMVFKIKNGTTTTDDPKTELDKVQIQPNLTALYLIIGVILGMVFSIIFKMYQKRKKDGRKTKSDGKGKEDIEQDVGKDTQYDMSDIEEGGIIRKSDIGQDIGIGMFEENAEEVKGQLETDPLLEEPVVTSTLNAQVNVENPLCKICMNLNRTRKAAAMCICCEEAMCLSCRNTHKVNKQTRDHKFVNIGKVPPHFIIPMICKKHQHKIEYFCTYHQCLCCCTCLSQDCQKRRTCNTIDYLSKNFMSTQVFKHHSEMVYIYRQICSNLNLSLYQHIDSQNFTMANVHKEELKTGNTSLFTSISDLADFATETENYNIFLNRHIDLLNFVTKFGTGKQLFILVHSSNDTLKYIRNKTSDIIANCKCIHFEDTVMPDFYTIKEIEDIQLQYIPNSEWQQSQAAIKQ